MLASPKHIISLVSSLLLFNCSPQQAQAGILSFMGRHLFGHSKDAVTKSHSKQTATSQVSNGKLPKPTRSVHPTRPFSATASWYGGKFNGRRTASGEVFDQNKFTAASRTLPLGTRLLVKNPANGKSCTVVVNDRGPFVKGRDIDLSRGAAQKIGVTGVSPVVCIADTSGVPNFGETNSHSGGLAHVPGKVLHMIAGII
jgi:rare lipoprotein A (peptidoglycan hydrolase)